MIAFSLFAAVSPTIIAAAPQSPKFVNDAIPHPSTDVKFPQRFAVPRQLDNFAGLTGGLPGAGLPSNSDESLPEADAAQASTPKGTKGMKDMKAVLANKLPSKSATDSTSNAAADPAMALNHPAEPEEPKAPSFAATSAPAVSSPESAVDDDSKTLSKDVAHDDAVPAIPDEHASDV